LGAAWGSFVNIFNPQMIMIGSGFAAMAEHLPGPARQMLAKYCFMEMRTDLTIACSSFGKDTVIFGAAAFAISSINR
jgi:predicted NBD/HSP70 family sugar kinase